MLVGHVRQVVILCSVNATKYYLAGLVSGCSGEVVFKTGSTVVFPLIDCNLLWTPNFGVLSLILLTLMSNSSWGPDLLNANWWDQV